MTASSIDTQIDATASIASLAALHHHESPARSRLARPRSLRSGTGGFER